MHLPILIQDLAAILGIAALATFIFRLTKQPVVLGYIVAGIIVGPFTPSIVSVGDVDSIKIWAELGVIFLMFALGLEFSFRRLARVGFSATLAVSFQILIMLFLGYYLGLYMNFSPLSSMFIGAMICISSTTIIIKTFGELGLNSKRFAELVYGRLIVEDLAAIIIIVALTGLATQESFSGIELLLTAGNMGLVVGTWLVVGIFLVPRFVKAVRARGNDEMLLIMSLGLCLALVSVSVHFKYSAALGAFIMGSIIAETDDSHHIGTLLSPLKDVFGAIFFVSVGMLLNPTVIFENWQTVAVISCVIIVGKIFTVSLGSLLTGQTIRTSINTGFSMAQIGEFSFIIAAVGLSYGGMDESLYPIIVACSLITTFTTPYLIKLAGPTASSLEKHLPQRLTLTHEAYIAWLQRQSSSSKVGAEFYIQLVRWGMNAILVVVFFIVSADKFLPLLKQKIPKLDGAQYVAWLFTILSSAPFIWAMFNSFKSKKDEAFTKSSFRLRSLPKAKILSRFATVILIGAVSSKFIPTWLAILVCILLSSVLFFIFRNQIESYYRWFENSFLAGISTEHANGKNSFKKPDHLIPWNAHLAEVPVNQGCMLIGKTLAETKIREQFNVNLVVIRRGDKDISIPGAQERIFPNDILLCVGTDEDLEKFNETISESTEKNQTNPNTYLLKPIEVPEGSDFDNLSIKDSKIRETFGCLVVGLERSGRRFISPGSDLVMQKHDLIWVVGDIKALDNLGSMVKKVPA